MTAIRTTQDQERDDEKKLRTLMRDKFGAGKYRIEKSGAVSVYGRAPNSIEVCWWMYGIDVAEALWRIEQK